MLQIYHKCTDTLLNKQIFLPILTNKKKAFHEHSYLPLIMCRLRFHSPSHSAHRQLPLRPQQHTMRGSLSPFFHYTIRTFAQNTQQAENKYLKTPARHHSPTHAYNQPTRNCTYRGKYCYLTPRIRKNSRNFTEQRGEAQTLALHPCRHQTTRATALFFCHNPTIRL